jgi:hypothetical protein
MLRSGIAALMLLLVASTSLVPAVSAAEAIGSAGDSGSGCTSCWCGNTLNANVITVELSGAEKNKLVSEALKNEEVKKIWSKLLEPGFTPKINEISVSIIKFETESGT